MNQPAESQSVDINQLFPPDPQTGIYLLSHSVGRPPANARQVLARDYFQAWESGRADTWNSWLKAIHGFNKAVAALLNGQASQICPQVNLSSALTKVMFALPRQAGRNVIVLTEHDFPSMGFVLEKARRAGFELRFIPADEDTGDAATWQRQLGKDVAMVFITHVQSNSGRQVPVADIAALARQTGCVSVVDIAQSAGVIPIDLQAWQADFVLGSCVKWSCGGPGAGYLWVSDEMAEQCQPVDVGWFSHAQPFEFDIHHFEYAPAALRFWGGTPSVMPYVVAANSIRQLHAYGISRIRQHNLRLSRLLMDAAGAANLVSPLQDDARGGTVVVAFPEAAQQKLMADLNAADVRFDGRASGIRLSAHIYNTQEEIETVCGILRAANG